jgi:hypothetical protein
VHSNVRYAVKVSKWTFKRQIVRPAGVTLDARYVLARARVSLLKVFERQQEAFLRGRPGCVSPWRHRLRRLSLPMLHVRG